LNFAVRGILWQRATGNFDLEKLKKFELSPKVEMFEGTNIILYKDKVLLRKASGLEDIVERRTDQPIEKILKKEKGRTARWIREKVEEAIKERMKKEKVVWTEKGSYKKEFGESFARRALKKIGKFLAGASIVFANIGGWVIMDHIIKGQRYIDISNDYVPLPEAVKPESSISIPHLEDPFIWVPLAFGGVIAYGLGFLGGLKKRPKIKESGRIILFPVYSSGIKYTAYIPRDLKVEDQTIEILIPDGTEAKLNEILQDGFCKALGYTKNIAIEPGARPSVAKTLVEKLKEDYKIVIRKYDDEELREALEKEDPYKRIKKMGGVPREIKEIYKVGYKDGGKALKSNLPYIALMALGGFGGFKLFDEYYHWPQREIWFPASENWNNFIDAISKLWKPLSALKVPTHVHALPYALFGLTLCTIAPIVGYFLGRRSGKKFRKEQELAEYFRGGVALK
jgi:hypothetical protein